MGIFLLPMYQSFLSSDCHLNFDVLHSPGFIYSFSAYLCSVHPCLYSVAIKRVVLRCADGVIPKALSPACHSATCFC